MSENLRTFRVHAGTKISEILDAFESSNQDLLLVDEHSVVTQPHLELLTDYPRTVTTALVAKSKGGLTRVSQGRITGATSGYHEVGHGNHTFLGIMRLSQMQRAEVIEVLTKVKDTKHAGNAIDLVLVALVRAALVVAPAEVAGAPFIRSSDAAEREAVKREIAALNDARLRLKLANRANDGFFSVFFLRKFSKLFTWAAVRLKMTPNQVTLISFAVGLYSAYQFSQGTFWSIIAGAVLLQLSIIIDCVDGELARYTRQFSQLGAWLDAITDRIKEYLVFFALAYGAAKDGRDLWIPAMGMMLFQTFRHLSDYNFARINKIRSSHLEPLDFEIKNDGYVSTEREKKSRIEYWSKKAVQFPIGERWLVISASSVIGGAAFTFTIMPFLALLSIALVFRGRIRKTLTWPKDRVNKNLIDDQLDSLRNENSTNRFDWLEPSLLRLVEGAVFIALAFTTDLDRSVLFLLLFAILFNHYDNMYRALQGEAKPKWLSIAGGFIVGRLLVIAVLVWGGVSLLPLLYYLGALFFVISSVQWIASRKAVAK
ncbi:CDP-alcohol phosphatidyltransferase [Candidatus Nanopelagicaceae bacterium]